MPRTWRAGNHKREYRVHTIVGHRVRRQSRAGFPDRSREREHRVKPNIHDPKSSGSFADKFGKVSAVQNVATPHKLTETTPLSREGFRLVFALSALFMAALWFGFAESLVANGR